MNIQPIVEGYGDVNAVPVLIRRLRDLCLAYHIDVNRPIRATRVELVREETLRTKVRLALLQPNCGAILIMFDADDDCPKELGPKIQQWANHESPNVPCAVVIANREYEAWFLASIESLRGRRRIKDNAVSHPQPELPRAAKAQLEERMIDGAVYSETIDQPALTQLFDMERAYARCRSFRRLISAFGTLSLSLGPSLDDWPPSNWHQEV